MHVALDVQIVNLRDAEQKVSGRWEVGGGLSDKGGDGAEGIKSIRNIHQTFFCVVGIAGASLHGLSDGANVINDVTMCYRDVGIRVDPDDDGAGRKRVGRSRVADGA